MVPQSYYRCWVEVDLDALRHNVAALRQRIGPATKLMAVVKADAYGHGLHHVGAELMKAGVDAFGVATLNEALTLRQIGGTGWPILLFGSALPFEVAKMVEQNITPTISTQDEARMFDEEARVAGKRVGVHIEVDTGMGRVGFWHEEAAEHIRAIAAMPHLHVAGLFTHFPSADENVAETKRELDLFLALARPLEVPLLHAANSAGLLNVPEAQLNLVRPGLLLYGIVPGGPGRDGSPSRPNRQEHGAPGARALPPAGEFHPVLSFKARVAFVKHVAAGRTISYGQTFVAPAAMRIATVTAGYSDGFSRTLSNNADVLIGGHRCRVVGRVTMDQIMVDVTGVADARTGDEVVFIGRQGDEAITASEVAGWEQTIPWEVLCGITKTARVPRVYLGTAAA